MFVEVTNVSKALRDVVMFSLSSSLSLMKFLLLAFTRCVGQILKSFKALFTLLGAGTEYTYMYMLS